MGWIDLLSELAGTFSGPYSSLRRVYRDAVFQAESGKGKERHACDGEAFENQQICEINRRLGSNEGALFQAVKKIYESKRLGREAAIRELLGALNYTAAAIILLREGGNNGRDDR